MPFQVKTTVNLTEQQVYDLLVTAREGGSNYWIDSYVSTAPAESFTPVDGEVYKFADYPLHGGSITITHDETEKAILNLENIQSGLQVMANKYNRHFTDLLNDNMDAITADVFLQCCVFGELVYG
jgi:hypothetical protein